MGLAGEIKPVLMNTVATLLAFIAGTIGAGAKVTIEDLMIRLHSVTGPLGDYLYTGRQLCSAIFGHALYELQMHGTHVYVMVMDNQNKVPKQKWATQAKRKAAKPDALKPYPLGTIMCDEGVRFESGVTEHLDIRRLLMSRHMRLNFALYLAEELLNYKIPEGRTLIFDFADEVLGALVYGNGCGHGEYLHEHGEADNQGAMWGWIFRDYDQVLVTTDTDWWLTAMNQISQREPGNTAKVVMRYNTERLLDLRVLYEGITSPDGLNMSIKAFVLACIVCGCDFVDKNDYSANIGPQTIFEYALAHHELLEEIAIYDADLPGLRPKALHVFHKDGIEPRIHMTNLPVDTKPASIKRAKSNQKREENNEEIVKGWREELEDIGTPLSTFFLCLFIECARDCKAKAFTKGFTAIKFTLGYWGYNWATCTASPPVWHPPSNRNGLVITPVH